ncbi:hypothetical protein GR160_04440 [Flavobacterium sp. Sd200]|uniref:hypothetical protein n=1 Tax=Flavobacterium sp. Sd200 TaxID=2692211 RepID=UPI00136F3251|nr:hypothetical protein [Flavobacterium sp. Sd200]MXN90467.1 hypothetical protein [Flavobacterium sp. Sd200]
MKRIPVLLLLLILIFQSCIVEADEYDSPVFYFNTAQPAAHSELKEYPLKFRGRYISDELTLVINGQEIFYEIPLNRKEPKSILNDSIKEKFSYKNGKLYSKGVAFDVIEKNDSLYLSAIIKDYLFKLDETHIAKAINNHLILSSRDSIFWKVKIFSLEGDSLKFRRYNSKKDFINIQTVVKNMDFNSDTTIVKLTPSYKEFKNLIELRSVGSGRSYQKLK